MKFNHGNDKFYFKRTPHVMVKFSENTIFSRSESLAFTTTLQQYKITRNRKLYDSGCSYNMFNSPTDFDILTLGESDPISMADGSIIYSKGHGNSLTLGKAMFVPDLSTGLISTPQDDLAGNFTLFGDKRVLVLDERPIITGNIIRTGTLVNDKQYLSDVVMSDIANYANTAFIYPIIPSIFRATLNDNISKKNWKFTHSITAHSPLRKINDMIMNKSLLGLPKKPIRIYNDECQPCILAKLKRRKVPSNKHNRPQSLIDPPKIYKPFEVVGCDIVDCGSDTLSLQGNRYATVFIDFYSDSTYIYYHKHIDDFLEEALKSFYFDIINPSKKKVDCFQFLQTDDSSTYTTKEVKQFLGEKGCLPRKSAPYHQAQNRRIEKAIERLLLTSTTLMIDSACPDFLWESALDYANDGRNDSLTNRHPSLTPSEQATHVKPTLVGRYPFFWPAYFILEHKKHFHPRSQQCYILRLQPGYRSSYLIYTPHSPSKLYVRFNIKPSKSEDTEDITNRQRTILPPLSLPRSHDDVTTTQLPLLSKDNQVTDYNNSPIISNNPIFSSSNKLIGSHDPIVTDDTSSEEDLPPNDNKRALNRRERKDRKKQKLIDSQLSDSLKRQARIRSLTSNLGPYWTHPPISYTPEDLVQEKQGVKNRRNDNKRSIKLNQKYYNLNKKNVPIIGRRPTRRERIAIAQANQANNDMPPTPTSIEQALSGPGAEHWLKAINEERTAISGHNTYENASYFKGKTVKSKIAFRVTREPEIFTYKARLVAKGYTERKGYDYFQTYAPTVLTKSVYMLLHLAATNDWEIRNLDVGGAYLESDIDTDLYMETPKEFSIDGITTTVKLKKSIHGLNQSGELWNNRIHKIFLSLGFTRSIDDPYVYARIINNERTYICLYVDDILVIGSHLSIIHTFETELSNLVQKLKVMGDTTKYVGIEIKRNRLLRKIYLSQQQFLCDVASTEGLSNTKITKHTPASPVRNLYTATRGTNPPIRSLVGKLRYAVDNTRPDSLFATSQLGSAAADPGNDHIIAANHLVTYLLTSKNLYLVLGGTDPIHLECFADSSFIETGDSKSQIAYCMRLCKTSGMFLSRSMKDNHIRLSSAESELFAVKEAIQDIAWSRNLLEFLGYPCTEPTPIYEDNQAVLFLTDTIKVHHKTRHINKILNFVREFISLNIILLIKVHTSLNIADILTKNLDKSQFLFLRNKLLGI